MKAVRQVIASNEFLYLQITSLGLHSTSGREKKGRKERNDGEGTQIKALGKHQVFVLHNNLRLSKEANS